MKILVFLFLYRFFLVDVQAEEPAGIVLYFQDEKTTYLLLADEAKEARGWSAFGGRR